MKQITKLLVTLTVFAAAAWSAETRYFGGIDLGSKGTKAALFKFIPDPEGMGVDVAYGRTINTKLVSSMNKDGSFTPEGMQSATDAVKTLVDEMKAEAVKRNLTNVEYFVVGSSGVAKGTNKDMLVSSVKNATDITMDFIDAKKEGFYGLLSTIPPKRRSVSMFVDVGSGNTKLGCLVGGIDMSSFRGAEIPFGSVTGRNKAVEISPTDIPAGIQKLMVDQVKPAYMKESMDTPCLSNRQRIYWTGGAAWATATFTHPERAHRAFVVVTKRDLDSFLAKLTDGTWNQGSASYPFPKDMPLSRQKEIRAKAEKDRTDVGNTFVKEDLLAGVSIMKTVLESSNASAVLQFVRSGNFLYGYAMEKFKEDKDGEESESGSAVETRYFGGIDLGSKGTKAALFKFIPDPEGMGVDVAYGRTINTKLVSSMNKDGSFTPEGMQSATDAVKTLVDEMKAEAVKRNLTNVEYFVVGSSGVAKGTNKDMLVSSVKNATDITMDFIDAKKEGFYGLLSTIPPKRRSVSMFVDVGSGNTKLGCLVGGIDMSSFRGAEIPFGSVTGRNKAVEISPTDIPAGIQKLMVDQVKPAYMKESMDTPCLSNRQRIYWTGGAAWATATFTHPERAHRAFVVVTKRDLDSFLAKLTDGTWNQGSASYPFPKDMPLSRQKEIRAKAEKDRTDVGNTFVKEDLLAGVSIMKTVLESSNASAVLQFVRSGNFLYGYAMEKFKEDKDGEESEK